MKRIVFMISDGTGITVESLSNSLLTQFEGIHFEKQTIPYVDTVKKAIAVVETINQAWIETNTKPLVFFTLINPDISLQITQANASFFDLFSSFLNPLENELRIKSSYTVGRAHSVSNNEFYDHRIDAVNFAIAHDDGVKPRGYDRADIILIGVSRCGKTPSCLYMALQFGILAANYPFTEEDLLHFALPQILKTYKHKLFGLTIDPERLTQIRNERQPNSKYASINQCRLEITEVEAMYRREKIPFLNSTHFSIEEIATKIIANSGIKRRI